MLAVAFQETETQIGNVEVVALHESANPEGGGIRKAFDQKKGESVLGIHRQKSVDDVTGGSGKVSNTAIAGVVDEGRFVEEFQKERRIEGIGQSKSKPRGSEGKR